MEFTISLKGVLIGILLIALIVLVIYLIILINNVTYTIKKANGIIDAGTNAAGTAKEKIDETGEKVKVVTSKVNGVAATGASIAGKVIDKVVNK